MCFSRRVSQTIDWLHKIEKPNGGISSLEDCNGHVGPVYPEVTGYLIPTLLKYDAVDLALRCADWLTDHVMTNKGVLAVAPITKRILFDTAMGARGLIAAYQFTGDNKYLKAYSICLMVLRDYKDRQLHISYAIKTYAELGYISDNWKQALRTVWPWSLRKERIHYIAYALEGCKQLGINVSHIYERIRELEKPYRFNYNLWKPINSSGVCVVGNFQMSILLDDQELFEFMEDKSHQPGGGLSWRPQDAKLSWTAKYYLDAAYYHGSYLCR